MVCTVRVAAVADCAAVADLRRAFFASQIAAGLLDVPDDVDGHVARTTPSLLTGMRNRIDIAVDGEGTAVGYLYAAVRVVPGTKSGSVGVIEETFLAPAARGTGIADRLLHAALTALTARGADRIQLRVLSGNAAGRAFWAKHGFVDNVAILELEPARVTALQDAAISGVDA